MAAVSGLLIILALGPASVCGQEEKKTRLFGPWSAPAEISYVVTGGNTTTSALSLGASLSRKWTNDTIIFKSYILKSKATTATRSARGTETDFEVIEASVTNTVAENYLLAGQYDRRISPKLLGQAGLSWDRNRFAGIDDRVIFAAGLGYAWVEKPRTQIKTSAGSTYTRRQYTGEDWTSFAGFRLGLLADQKILESSSLSTQFVFDENLKEMNDWRFDWLNEDYQGFDSGAIS